VRPSRDAWPTTSWTRTTCDPAACLVSDLTATRPKSPSRRARRWSASPWAKPAPARQWRATRSSALSLTSRAKLQLDTAAAPRPALCRPEDQQSHADRPRPAAGP
jgi:hypothetical protein